MRMLSPLSVIPMSNVFDEVDRLMETFANAPVRTGGLQSEVDLHEGDDHFIVSFDMPGVKRENIKVEMRGQQLWISSERQRPNKAQEKYERSFTLPTSIDKEKIEVQYEDGVLSLLLPKAEAAKPRTFEVQSGTNQSFFSRLLSSKQTEEKKTVN